jgi:hypothetical protein
MFMAMQLMSDQKTKLTFWMKALGFEDAWKSTVVELTQAAIKDLEFNISTSSVATCRRNCFPRPRRIKVIKHPLPEVAVIKGTVGEWREEMRADVKEMLVWCRKFAEEWKIK